MVEQASGASPPFARRKISYGTTDITAATAPGDEVWCRDLMRARSSMDQLRNNLTSALINYGSCLIIIW